MKAIEQKSGKRKEVVEPLTPGGESADSPAPKKRQEENHTEEDGNRVAHSRE